MVCVREERDLISPPSGAGLASRAGLASGHKLISGIKQRDGFSLDFSKMGLRVPYSANHEVRETVRQAVDIVDLVGSYLQLVRKGNIHLALCPWHEDTRPSLQINPQRQTYQCFVCSHRGDIFSFVMDREGLSFPEALRFLADRAGITLPKTFHGEATADTRKRLQSVLDFAAQEFHHQLLESADAAVARDYLAKRGISQPSIEQFMVGYSPSGWTWFRDRAYRRGYTEVELEQSGMLVKSAAAERTFDRFRQRLMFPIRDPQGRVIAFGGRILPGAPEDSAKYINSPETKLFTKNQQLYALDVARQHTSRDGSILVMEGYTDVIMAHQHGVKNAVAVLGTALGTRHLQLLQRYADRVVLVLDGDEAGRRRANEVVELFMASPLDVRVCTLPNQLDPCDLLVQSGSDALRSAVVAADDALSHKLSHITRNVDLVRDPHSANKALEEMLQLVTRIPADSQVDDGRFQLRARQTVGLLARVFQIPPEAIQSRISQLKRNRNDHTKSTAETRAKLQGIDLDVLGLMTRHSQMISEVVRTIHSEWLETDVARQLFLIFANAIEEHPTVDFGFVLAMIEEPELKSILVEIDDLAGRHVRLCTEPRSLLEEIQASLDKRHWARMMNHQLTQLESKEIDEVDQLRAVEQIVAQQRSSQGIPQNSPTDG
jgi:DNA primase